VRASESGKIIRRVDFLLLSRRQILLLLSAAARTSEAYRYELRIGGMPIVIGNEDEEPQEEDRETLQNIRSDLLSLNVFQEKEATTPPPQPVWQSNFPGAPLVYTTGKISAAQKEERPLPTGGGRLPGSALTTGSRLPGSPLTTGSRLPGAPLLFSSPSSVASGQQEDRTSHYGGTLLEDTGDEEGHYSPLTATQLSGVGKWFYHHIPALLEEQPADEDEPSLSLPLGPRRKPSPFTPEVPVEEEEHLAEDLYSSGFPHLTGYHSQSQEAMAAQDDGDYDDDELFAAMVDAYSSSHLALPQEEPTPQQPQKEATAAGGDFCPATCSCTCDSPEPAPPRDDPRPIEPQNESPLLRSSAGLLFPCARAAGYRLDLALELCRSDESRRHTLAAMKPRQK